MSQILSVQLRDWGKTATAIYLYRNLGTNVCQLCDVATTKSNAILECINKNQNLFSQKTDDILDLLFTLLSLYL